MSKTRRTLYVPERVDAAVEEMSAETARRRDLEDRSESQIYRDLLRAAFEQSDDVEDLLDDADKILQRREQYINREARLNSLRVGFEARIRRHLKNRFEDGIKREQIEVFAEGLREDARILWPDNDERREEAIAYVDECSEAMRDAAAVTDYDPLDPSEIFGSYGTVETSIEQEEGRQQAGDIRAEIRLRRKRLESRGQTVSQEDLVTAVSNKCGVSETAVRSVLEGQEQPALTSD